MNLHSFITYFQYPNSNHFIYIHLSILYFDLDSMKINLHLKYYYFLSSLEVSASSIIVQT